MPNIFGGYAGRVVAVGTGDDFYTPLGLIFDDFKIFLGAKGIMTGLSVDGNAGFQVMHTLRQYIYVYTFGERAGEITISGLASVSSCEGVTNPINGEVQFAGGGGAGGLERIYDWYERRRISTTGAPIQVTLGPSLTVQAFLVNFKYQMEDPSISLGQFAMRLFYPPRQRDPDFAVQYNFPNLFGGSLRLGDSPVILGNGSLQFNITLP